MKRRVLSLVVILIFIISICQHTYAYGGEDHDRIMKTILFGKNVSESTLEDKAKNTLSALNDACYLTLDQCNAETKHNGTAELIALKNMHVWGLPKDISDIDFNGNQRHRMYTHKGWDHKYTNDKANWEVRKQILTNTVNKVFDFGFSSNFGFIEPTDKCKSFAAFLYYIHVLGDYLEPGDPTAKDSVDYYEKNDNDLGWMIDFVNYTDNNLVSEVNKHLLIIFDDQKGDANKLVDRLNRIAVNAKKVVSGVESRYIRGKEFDTLSGYIEEYRDTLVEYIPPMLEKEEFFKDVFYKEEKTSWLPWG